MFTTMAKTIQTTVTTTIAASLTPERLFQLPPLSSLLLPVSGEGSRGIGK